MSAMFPTKEAELLQFSLNFKTLITANAQAYGLSAAQASGYGTLHSNYGTALAAVEPSIRSKTAVVAKNVAKTALKNGFRLLAAVIENTPSVTPSQKTELGLSNRSLPKPIPAPTTAPTLTVLSVNGWTVKIKLKAIDAARRGKPPGVLGASVFSYVGINPPTDIANWKFEGSVGRTKVDVVFNNTLAAGAKIWLTAFWFNGRKQSGPATSPVGTCLQGSGVQMTVVETETSPLTIAA